MSAHPNGAARLVHLGVIRAVGADAAVFLHGQLTQDVLGMQPGQSRLAAWCNAQGRMLASCWVHRRADDELLLVLSRDLLASTLKRLSMFVLRAPVKLTDACAEFAIYGLLGDAARAPRAQAADVVIPLPPADDAPRALFLAPSDASAPDAPYLLSAVWHWAAVRSGVATITTPVVQAFVPQMLNYESVGGVNFKKGCYPGQEVVARSQFRGAIKRRAWVARVDANAVAQAGQAIFHDSDRAQPAGMVVQAAMEPPAGAIEGGTALIACLPSAAVEAAQKGNGYLTLGAPNGPALADLHRPYPLLQDV
ncbi:MAG: folate-binding protein [Burkholderiaceae bacterium]|nr:folate-binding protein [Burkholderiaceae bacterium]